MVSVYFKLTAAFVFCLIVVFIQKPFLAEDTSQTPDDHVVHKIAHLGAGNALLSQFEDITATTSALLLTVEKDPIDQSDRALADGLSQFISTFAGTGIAAYNGDNIAVTSAQF